MLKIKEKIISLYNEYKIFDDLQRKENKELQSKEELFQKLMNGDNIEENADNLKNFYKDNIIKNSQVRMNFEHLMFLISVYSETESDLPEEIKKFYNDYLPVKTKEIFKIETDKVIVTDLEALENQRKALDNLPLMQILKNQAPE